WSTSKTPSYTKSVSWQHHLKYELDIFIHKNYSSTAYRGGYVKPLISLKTKTNFQIYYLTNE
ncbi:hypothetical protein, partial [Escherichia coli]|uniref:hypothetical protein n=1 Tax=Escherichia coli TaxID=562 RepID=UPI001BD23480